MKICPICQKTYDDTQNFCLEDGTTLTGASAARRVLPPPAGAPRRGGASARQKLCVSS